MNEEKYDRDTEYWNEFYMNDKGEHTPSLFAEYIWDSYLKNGNGNLLELGCGNGRDSAFFLSKGIMVTAIDASQNAIQALGSKYNGNSNAIFLCGDFVNYKYKQSYKYCYSRFSIHAISEEQESQLIKNLSDHIIKCGYLFIEVRSVNDELYGKGKKVGEESFVFDGHYRRFLRMGDLISKLENAGFIIDYASEKRGFAPYKDEDPYVIRVIAKKSGR